MKKLLFISLAICFGWVSQAQVDTSNILMNGQQMPNFKISTMDGKTVQSAELKGKTVLINFFATWCGPCRKELPHVESDIWKKYKDRDDFLLLIIGREEDSKKIAPFIKDNDYTMPFYGDIDRSCYKQFAHKFIPRNYLFNSKGKLIYQSRGFNEKEFEEMKKNLAEQLD
ncbi:MAG: TlpA family protein disulfide reductase [Bacteroidetes bacterium]|nr:TlpA family protein disulfide reductase [Bacteroidota bacterium]MBT3750373.1 TlpA family protein disulfide reductase [Bacteroidota bacterium]MBT4398945.1 TlpA family protein disulfide reductase [Bacteroidota bacterium]MBT4409706.1 TlpA family protein disulfide reductase [Bacteroidota bacterium]MBT5425022.1 TlpA family protein disulfide reductase [Bacteroidota bacterium]